MQNTSDPLEPPVFCSRHKCHNQRNEGIDQCHEVSPDDTLPKVLLPASNFPVDVVKKNKTKQSLTRSGKNIVYLGTLAKGEKRH